MCDKLARKHAVFSLLHGEEDLNALYQCWSILFLSALSLSILLSVQIKSPIPHAVLTRVLRTIWYKDGILLFSCARTCAKTDGLWNGCLVLRHVKVFGLRLLNDTRKTSQPHTYRTYKCLSQSLQFAFSCAL